MKEYLGNRINIDSANDWQDVIRKAGAPLVSDGCIDASYVEDMIEVVNEFGGYIVLTPGFCMPHSKNKDNVKQTSISILALKDSNIHFPGHEDERPVEIVMCLAAMDTEAHRDLLMKVATLLGDEELLEQWFAAKDVATIEKLVNDLSAS